MRMRILNEYPSKELGVLLNLLKSTSPTLPTERTLRKIWIDRLTEAHKDAFDSEQELPFKYPDKNYGK